MSRRSRSAVKLVDGLSVLLALLDVQRADRPAADAAGQARAGEQRNGIAGRRQADLPAEEEDHVLRRVLAPAATAAATATGVAGAELEDARVLEEEVALLGEEQAEARQVDLLLVGFDLREVGVDREVPRQPGRDAVLHVEAGVVVLVERHAGRACSSCASAYGLTRTFAPGFRPCRPSKVPAIDTRDSWWMRRSGDQ